MTAGERDVEALAEVLASHEEFGGGWYCSCTPIDPDTEGHEPIDEPTMEQHLATAILASDWLRDHDAEVRAQAKRDAVGPVMALHQPFECCNVRCEGGGLHCATCNEGGNGDVVFWPCPTYRAALGEQP